MNAELFLSFDSLMRIFRTSLTDALKQHGHPLSPPDVSLLALLKTYPGMSLQQLVIETRKDKAQITRKIKELERKKLIYRQKNLEDQRSYQLFLTQEGKRVQTHTLAIRMKTYRQLFLKLSKREKEQLNDLLKKCI